MQDIAQIVLDVLKDPHYIIDSKKIYNQYIYNMPNVRIQRPNHPLCMIVSSIGCIISLVAASFPTLPQSVQIGLISLGNGLMMFSTLIAKRDTSTNHNSAPDFDKTDNPIYLPAAYPFQPAPYDGSDIHIPVTQDIVSSEDRRLPQITINDPAATRQMNYDQNKV
jgi:hypothetical protein